MEPAPRGNPLGASLDRPALQNLLADVKAGKIIIGRLFGRHAMLGEVGERAGEAVDLIDHHNAVDSRRRTPGSGGRAANRSLSAIEPVSAPPKRKLDNRQQRPAPETRPTCTEIPEIANQRLGRASLTRGNVGDSTPPGK